MAHPVRQSALLQLLTNFVAKVVVQPDVCWRWTGALSLSGRCKVRYPALRWAGHVWRVNRLLLVLATTPLAEAWVANREYFADYDASHTCDHSWCVNPAHLVWETHCANVQNQAARKAAQPQGAAA